MSSSEAVASGFALLKQDLDAAGTDGKDPHRPEPYDFRQAAKARRDLQNYGRDFKTAERFPDNPYIRHLLFMDFQRDGLPPAVQTLLDSATEPTTPPSSPSYALEQSSPQSLAQPISSRFGSPISEATAEAALSSSKNVHHTDNESSRPTPTTRTKGVGMTSARSTLQSTLRPSNSVRRNSLPTPASFLPSSSAISRPTAAPSLGSSSISDSTGTIFTSVLNSDTSSKLPIDTLKFPPLPQPTYKTPANAEKEASVEFDDEMLLQRTQLPESQQFPNVQPEISDPFLPNRLAWRKEDGRFVFLQDGEERDVWPRWCARPVTIEERARFPQEWQKYIDDDGFVNEKALKGDVTGGVSCYWKCPKRFINYNVALEHFEYQCYAREDPLMSKKQNKKFTNKKTTCDRSSFPITCPFEESEDGCPLKRSEDYSKGFATFPEKGNHSSRTFMDMVVERECAAHQLHQLRGFPCRKCGRLSPSPHVARAHLRDCPGRPMTLTELTVRAGSWPHGEFGLYGQASTEEGADQQRLVEGDDALHCAIHYGEKKVITFRKPSELGEDEGDEAVATQSSKPRITRQSTKAQSTTSSGPLQSFFQPQSILYQRPSHNEEHGGKVLNEASKDVERSVNDPITQRPRMSSMIDRLNIGEPSLLLSQLRYNSGPVAVYVDRVSSTPSPSWYTNVAYRISLHNEAFDFDGPVFRIPLTAEKSITAMLFPCSENSELWLEAPHTGQRTYLKDYKPIAATAAAFDFLLQRPPDQRYIITLTDSWTLSEMLFHVTCSQVAFRWHLLIVQHELSDNLSIEDVEYLSDAIERVPSAWPWKDRKGVEWYAFEFESEHVRRVIERLEEDRIVTILLDWMADKQGEKKKRGSYGRTGRVTVKQSPTSVAVQEYCERNKALFKK